MLGLTVTSSIHVHGHGSFETSPLKAKIFVKGLIGVIQLQERYLSKKKKKKRGKTRYN